MLNSAAPMKAEGGFSGLASHTANRGTRLHASAAVIPEKGSGIHVTGGWVVSRDRRLGGAYR